jgi:DNA-binding IclR family transcriptional regulator
MALAKPEERALAETERTTWRTAPHLALADNDHGGTEIAVPVLDGYGRAAAALTATVGHDDVDRAAAHLARAAQAASRTLGHE